MGRRIISSLYPNPVIGINDEDEEAKITKGVGQGYV